MAKECQISGKKALRGNNVSHANNRRKKVFSANLQRKRIYDSETGQWFRLRISSRLLRTIDKVGLSATLKKHGLTIDSLKS